MSGQLLETPLADGTARIRANLRFENLPFAIGKLQSFEDSWVLGEDGQLYVDSDKRVWVLVDGRATLRVVWEFRIVAPEARISFDNVVWPEPDEAPERFVATLSGEGMLTEEGGFEPGPARICCTQIGPPALPLTDWDGVTPNPHDDGMPVETINIIPQR